MKDKTTKSLWRNKDFLLLWSGQTISMLGSQLSMFVLPLLVLALTKSPVQAGLIMAVERGIYLLLGLPVGALVDYWNRKWIMIISDIARCIAYGSLPIAYLTGHLSILHLYFIAIIGGIALTFFDMADDVAFPLVVGVKQLNKAAGLMEGMVKLVELLGPGIAGFIIGLTATVPAGATVIYLADSLSYLCSILTLLHIRKPMQNQRTPSTFSSLRRQIIAGARFLWERRHLRLLAFFTLSWNIFVTQITLAMIILAKNEFRANPFNIGFTFGIGGLGGIVGILLIPFLQARLRVGQLLLGIVILWTGGIFLQAMAPSTLIQMIGWVIFTFSASIYYTITYTYRVSLVPDELQGSVNSVYRLLIFGGTVLGPIFGGLLLDLLTARIVLWIIALACLVLLTTFTELRKI